MNEENEGESLLDAINSAIPSAEPAEEVENEEPEIAEGEEAEETPEGEEGAEGEEEAEGEEGAEGEEEAEGEQTGEEKAAAAAKAAKAPAKEPDPINDPLPRGTLQSTAERFKHVVDKLKEQTTRAETIETQHQELISEITGAGMGGAEFGYMLEYASGVNSGTVEGLTKARGILLKELEAVSTALGEPMPGTDPLKAHADLVAEVNAKTLTPERALEIARQRNREAAQAKLNQAKQTTQQSTQQQAQATAKGKADLTALGKELSQKDGVVEYRRKAGLVVAMLKDTLTTDVPPQKWARAFRAAYDKVPAAPKAAPAAKPGQKPQPLRGNKVPAGGSSKEPKNMREAINAAFE